MMYVNARGTPLLFLIVLFTLCYKSQADLIADTCKKATVKDDATLTALCISTLRSYPPDETADVKGLAVIMLKVLSAEVSTTLGQVNDLLKKTKDKAVKGILIICASEYGDTLDNINEAIGNLGKDNTEAISQASAVFAGAGTCEDSFTEEPIVIKSPFTANYEAVIQLLKIALGIMEDCLQ